MPAEAGEKERDVTWPKKWKILSDGCGLKDKDKLEIDGTKLKAKRGDPPDEEDIDWGENFTEDPNDDKKATVDSGGVSHILTYTPAKDDKKAELKCTYPGGTLGFRRRRRHGKSKGEHKHHDPHTGGPIVSWTAEEGG